MIASPYKGLMPYDENDAAFFFGRDAEREIIVNNLMAARLTLLYGASGVGKSSLLRAGVAHSLRTAARKNFAQRGNPESIVVVFSSWRDDPVRGLLAQVEQSVAEATGTSVETQHLAMENGLVNAVEELTQRLDCDLLFLFDQFEEYFLYHPQEDGEGTFATEFPRLINRRNLRVNALIAIREDALAKLDRFEGRIPKLFDNYLRVEHLSRDAARSAIQEPIAQFNRANDAHVSIEPALVNAVLDQVKTGQVHIGEAGRGVIETDQSQGEPLKAQIETPYLQLVMTRLWDEETTPTPTLPRDKKTVTGEGDSPPSLAGKGDGGLGWTLRLETLNRLGGAERIVRTHLDKTMSGLPADERDAAARTFNFLVTPSGTKIAHTARDLAEYANVPEAQLAPVLEKLTTSGLRILRPVAPPPDQLNAPPRYEIFHDVLAPAMLDWRTRYTERQRQTKAEEQLAIARQRVTRLRLGLVGVSVLLLAMIALAIFSVQQRDAATRAQAESVVQRDAAQKANVETVLQRDAAQKAQADAIAQRDAAEKAKADAEYQRQVAFTRELSVNAVTNLDVDPERSILLALQAVSVSTAGGKPVLREAEEALHRAVDESRVQLTLRGHANSVQSVAYSPDGRRLGFIKE